MAHYFFHTRDNDEFLEDADGLDFPDSEQAKAEAARSLAELAREVVPGSQRRELSVEVHDMVGPVFRARMSFEAVVLRAA